MCGDFVAEEAYALAKFINAVNAVFDANPTVEADAGQLAENGVVII